jgi:hypothetical protein
LVISFSVINYVVSLRRPRASGEVSFFLFIVIRIRVTKNSLFREGAACNLDGTGC